MEWIPLVLGRSYRLWRIVLVPETTIPRRRRHLNLRCRSVGIASIFCSLAPYGFETVRFEVKPNVFRSVLVPHPEEADTVRRLFELYIALGGAKMVARQLNQSGSCYRSGRLWSKDLVLHILNETAVAGTYYWGKYDRHRRLKDRSQWLALKVTPIVDPARYDLAHRLRTARAPTAHAGYAAEKPTLLSRLVHCAKCGASYQLESSGKRAASGEYKYRYYNCRNYCRIGKEACVGGRIPMAKLDMAVLSYVASIVCSQPRCRALASAVAVGEFARRVEARSQHLRTALDDLRTRIHCWDKLSRGSAMHREFALGKLEQLQRTQRELDDQLAREIASIPRTSDDAYLDPARIQEAWTGFS